MEIGIKIKVLRLKQGITQEKLAEKLNISSQAISKWENNLTTPDISLLPQLSVIFGVTIDELFSLTDENHLNRIENAIDNERMLSRDVFDSYKEYLLSKLNDDDNKARVLTLSSALYNQQANGYFEISKNYAFDALKLNPTSKENHNLLSKATNGVIVDWNIANHHEMIKYYFNFISEHPDYNRGYLWLLDLLIADGRCKEAREILEKMKKVDGSYRYLCYKSLIEKKNGNIDLAIKYINEMTNNYPDDWLSWFSKANFYATLCKYDNAIENYIKACNMQPSPKYTDSYEGIANIYEIEEKYDEAIKYYNMAIELLKTDWKITEGEPVDYFKRCIHRIESL
ncbi:helix-turn-helix domain-containing protein [Sedimentibacter sp. zth1]|uniref:helix-turn-helix domain-containing protein n=1 Tax=Sedimentibacter sp. zth1 TaxID=2816908 RepID=UPI001A92DB1A|nr:helix-turn-helix transcriptional regulator [Sedimentibacter sp. zth1]QSX06296.1 helix-turn-helix domain-containing protein [Sedimentibacter sp. zth1]